MHEDYTMCPQFGRTNINPGGFAEYFKVPAENLKVDTFKIPANVSFEEATLIEPTACCIRAQNKLAIQTGDTIAIIGAGPSGVLHLLLSKMGDANKVIVSDLIDYRLRMAEKFGADMVVNSKQDSLSEAVKGATDGRGADVVIVTAPVKEALMNSMKICRRGGTVCLFAPTQPNEYARISPHRLFFSEITVIPSYSTSHVETRIAMELIGSGRIQGERSDNSPLPVEPCCRSVSNSCENQGMLEGCCAK